MSESEEEKALRLLSEGIKSGKIDIGSMRSKVDEMERVERAKLLHKSAIYEVTVNGKTFYRTNFRDKNGKRYCVQREHKEDLLRYLSEYYIDGKHRRKAVTFKSLYEEWLEVSMESSLDLNTVRRYEQYYLRYYNNASWVIKPIEKVTCIDLEDWAKRVIHNGRFAIHKDAANENTDDKDAKDKNSESKEENELTRKEYTNMTVILRQVFRRAFKSGKIEKDPVAYMDLRIPFRPEIKKSADIATYSKAEAEELIQVSNRDYEATGDIAALLPQVLLMTGGRDAEVLGLKWSDLSKDWKTVTIERQYKMCTVGKKDDKWITETKTVNHTKSSRTHKIDTGVRTIPVVPELEKILRKIEVQKTVDAEDIFVRNDGTHLTSGMVKAKLYKYARWLKMDCVKSAHDLRRTCATFLKAAGATDEQIRIILGHSDIKTTQESYIFDQSAMEDKEDLMEKAVGSLPELIPVKRFGGIRRIK